MSIYPDCISLYCQAIFICFNAQVVIAKGQGNYEKLENCSREIFFMFKVKCDTIAKHAGHKVGTSVLLKN